jgi:hypothetical protein
MVCPRVNFSLDLRLGRAGVERAIVKMLRVLFLGRRAQLYRRTNDPIWLDRARQFAMTAIVQYRGSQVVVGRGRYSLWTGDVGLAIYLWDCITGEPRFPTIDVF